jgi:DsbC/DsbD-like thiol-disulfide interchange protein
MTEITPPGSPPAAQSVTIRCDFSWLICKEICVARDAELQLVLPVSQEEPGLSAEWHELFERTRKRL